MPDIVEAFAAWGIIFALAEAGFKFVFKDRIKFLSANKVLHILYISIYAITALILTIVPLDGNTDVKGLYVVLAVFFIIGYAGLGMMAIFNKLKNILLNQLGN
ncbi:MAG TPA: hypothetical protein VG604_00350 [Candidatus Saccharimonadales bacterium]|nr:hypothetical protein [Candidatus Saccharimonadales bacterium]